VDNCVRKFLNLIGGKPGIGPQDRGDPHVGIQQHRNQWALLVHGICFEDGDLILLPCAGERGVGEEHYAAVALFQAIVNSGYEVIAGPYFPNIPPCVNTL
jgi:hypothetical protein